MGKLSNALEVWVISLVTGHRCWNKSLKRSEEFKFLLDHGHLWESRTIIKFIIQIWTLWKGTWGLMNNYSEKRGISEDYPRQTVRYTHIKNLMKSIDPLIREKKFSCMHTTHFICIVLHSSHLYFKNPWTRCIHPTFISCSSPLSQILCLDAGDTTLH